MTNFNHSPIPRRTFLKGAAGVLAAGTSGGALAQLGGGNNRVSVAWWDGGRFVPLGSIPAGTETLSQIQVNLRGYGSGSLLAVDTLFPVALGKGVSELPFRSWSAPPQGVAATQFHQEVGSLSFNIRSKVGSSEVSTGVRLEQGSAAGSALREGTYVIAAGSPKWSLYSLGVEQSGGPVRGFDQSPASFQYITLLVERA